MTRIVTALVLGVFWIAITGSVSPGNLLLGIVVGYACIALVRGSTSPQIGRPRIGRLTILGLVFLYEIVASAWRVAKLVLKPRIDIHPVIIGYPLSVKSDFEILLLANMITLTPGTLSVDVSADRCKLYIHAIDSRDDAQTIADIERTFERRIREAFG
jgi:multicomponent Na+:H+ antiporter subunit E